MCDSAIKTSTVCVHMHIQENYRIKRERERESAWRKRWKKIQNERIFKKHKQLNRKNHTML